MARAVLRPRRQLTLPRDVCHQLGIDIGDQVDLSVEDGTLVVTPSRKLALDALAEIQSAFARSGLTEEELQRAAREARTELIRERYGRSRSA
jgi:antitoxin component of MazEF toxin-antitoxin module